MMKVVFYILPLMALPCSVLAQEVILNFHHLSTQEGLLESTNDFLHVDQFNLTWIASLNGLNQFDGKEVNTFNERSQKGMLGFDLQSPFFENEAGDIFFTTAKAINKYNRQEASFEAGIPQNSSSSKSPNPYAFFLEQDSLLWFIQAGKIYRINAQQSLKQFSQALISNAAAIRADAQINEEGKVERVIGALWMQNGFEVHDFKVNDTITYRLFDQVGNPAPFKLRFKQVISNLDGQTCLLSKKGLYFFNPEAPYEFEKQFFPCPEDFQDLEYMTKVGNQLILCNRSGQLATFNWKAKSRGFNPLRIRAFNLDNKEFIHKINKLFIGRDSILWLEVKSEGVYFANLKQNGFYPLFSKNNIAPHYIRDFFEYPDGRILAIDPNGKLFLFNSEGNLLEQVNGPKSLRLLQRSNGEIWSSSQYGLGKGDPLNKKIEIKIPSEITRNIQDFINYQDKYLILTTMTGIWLYDLVSDTFSLVNTPQGIYYNKLKLDSKGNLWTSTFGGTINRWQFKEDSKELILLDSIANEGIVNQFQEDIIRNQLYVATSQGLISIKLHPQSHKIIKTTLKWENQYVRSVLLDPKNHIWLSTNQGIWTYCPEMEGSSIRHLNVRDGLSDNEYNNCAALLSKSGHLWFGSTKGVDRIPFQLKSIAKIPKPIIKSLTIHDQLYTSDSLIQFKKKISLTYKQNTLSFKLQAPEYTDSKRVTFKVHLYHKNGVDSNIIRGTNNTYTYTNLSYGNYRFEYTASNSEGVWREEPGSLQINIKPPFYLQGWFIIIMSLLGSFLTVMLTRFFYVYRLRSQQLKVERQERIIEREQQKIDRMEALQTERDRIAQELHDELNGGLSTIQFACARAEKYSNSNKIDKSLDIISRKTQELLKTKEHLIWAMSPESSTIKELVAQIRYHSVSYFEDNQVPIQVDINGFLPELEISSTAKYNIFLVIKELMHNIIKSAQCTEASLNICLAEQNLKIEVADNGIGMDLTELTKNKAKSYGLHKCQEWINDLAGEITWNKPKWNTGTVVKIDLPLHKLLLS